MPKLTYRAADHSYWLGATRLVSVTQVLSAVSIISYPPGNEFQRDRGTQVHLALELDDAGDLNLETLDPRILPYLTAWRRFKEQSMVTILHTEKKVYSKLYQYAGRVDRVVSMGGIKTVLEVKTGTVMPWAGVQMSAYQNALYEMKINTFQRVVVELPGDGSYKLHEFNDRNDWPKFRKALLDYKEMKKCKRSRR